MFVEGMKMAEPEFEPRVIWVPSQCFLILESFKPSELQWAHLLNSDPLLRALLIIRGDSRCKCNLQMESTLLLWLIVIIIFKRGSSFYLGTVVSISPTADLIKNQLWSPTHAVHSSAPSYQKYEFLSFSESQFPHLGNGAHHVGDNLHKVFSPAPSPWLAFDKWQWRLLVSSLNSSILATPLVGDIFCCSAVDCGITACAVRISCLYVMMFCFLHLNWGTHEFSQERWGKPTQNLRGFS